VAGYGLPGRATVEWLQRHNIEFCVVDLNPQTVSRCARHDWPIIEVNIKDEQTLRRAGIERATLLALAVPDEQTVRDATVLARRLNPSVYIIARMNFTSGGLQAVRLGANEAVVAEQAVALEFARLLSNKFG
jgi:CPA2 family monovalent cation:H+ antiporter-2